MWQLLMVLKWFYCVRLCLTSQCGQTAYTECQQEQINAPHGDAPLPKAGYFLGFRLCSKSSWDSSSFWLVSIRLRVLKSLLLSFGFGPFALLLSVSHSAWPTALCSNYMVGEGWESVRVSTRLPPLPQSTALHISVWLWFKNCGLGSDRIPWKGFKKNLKNRQSYWQSVMNVLLTTAKLCLSDSYMVSKPARTYYACRKVIER